MPYHAIEDPQRLRALLDAALVVESDLDLPTILRHVAETATALVEARYGAVGVLDASGERLVELHTAGVAPEVHRIIGRRPAGLGVLGLVIRDPRPIRLRNLGVHPRSVGFPPGHPPMRSFLGVPIRTPDGVFGSLYLTEKMGAEEFSEADEQMAMGLAVAAGIAVHNARLHLRLAELSRLEDRERIARDLHDTVIQRLFATGLRLQGLTGLFQVPVVAGRVQEAVDELDETIRQIRTTIFALSSTGNGLRDRVMAVVDEVMPALGFIPEVRLDGPLEAAVGDHLGDHLLATLREALTNVAKHARATRASVMVTVRGPNLVLEVLDDGVGVPDGRQGAGLGLANMGRRAGEMGGKLVIRRRAEGGTHVTWQVPMGGQETVGV